MQNRNPLVLRNENPAENGRDFYGKVVQINDKLPPRRKYGVIAIEPDQGDYPKTVLFTYVKEDDDRSVFTINTQSRLAMNARVKFTLWPHMDKNGHQRFDARNNCPAFQAREVRVAEEGEKAVVVKKNVIVIGGYAINLEAVRLNANEIQQNDLEETLAHSEDERELEAANDILREMKGGYGKPKKRKAKAGVSQEFSYAYIMDEEDESEKPEPRKRHSVTAERKEERKRKRELLARAERRE